MYVYGMFWYLVKFYLKAFSIVLLKKNEADDQFPLELNARIKFVLF